MFWKMCIPEALCRAVTQDANLEFPHRGDEANGQLPKEVLQSAVKVVERAAAAVLLGSADDTGITDSTGGADISSSKDLRMKVGDVTF